jgi:thiamine pyrophosphate-dependent acetolactate synthase large subunit-like protein
VTASVPQRDIQTNPLQGAHDQIVLAAPITKFCTRITAVEEIPRIVSYAWRVANSGAPGPVLLDFPIDILFTPPQVNSISWGSVNQPTLHPPAPSATAVSELVKLWKVSSRPAIIAGTGAARTTQLGNEQSILLKLAESSQTPVFYTNKYSPALPYQHPLRGGPAKYLAYLPAIGQPQPDLIILLGSRTGFLLGGRSGAVIPNQNCKLVHVDIDGSEIGRLLPADLGIISDAMEFVNSAITAIASESDFTAQRDSEWIKTAAGAKNLVHQQYGSDPKQGKPDQGFERIHPYHAIQTLFESVRPYHPLVIIDGGECGVWAHDLVETAEPAHTLNATGYMGFLGNGFGYSLGAAVACPDQLVVNVQGDGSAGFHIAELDTYVRHGLRILTVVVNNFKWGMSIAGQDLIYGDAAPARLVSSLSPVCRFDAVAEGFGCLAVRCTKVDELAEAVSSRVKVMLEGKVGRAALVDLIVDTEPVTAFTKGAVDKPGPNEAAKKIVVPYYDNIPRPFYKD